MSDIQAIAGGVAVPEIASRAVVRAPAGLMVEVADAARLSRLRPEWVDLLARADVPNVLMDPAMVQAAADVFPQSQSQAVLVWKPSAAGRQLAGLWAFSVGRPHQSVLPMRALTIPPGPHRYLATPVIDRTCLDETLHAMLDALAADPRLPKIAALDAMSAECPTTEALVRVLAARGSAPCWLERLRQRPKLASNLDGKTYLEKALSSSSRKKLRQHRRRLAERGRLSHVVAADPESIRRALEDFLRMEASGWKGRECTALLSDAENAAYVRRSIVGMAEQGCAAIHALYLDDRPVSMQIVVRAGAVAYTWKTAYDEAFSDFSPGMLLLEDYTAAFLADKSIAYVDSCSHDDNSYMAAWTERRAVADVWIDARRGGSLAFSLLAFVQKRYRDLRSFGKSAYGVIQRHRKRH